MGKQSATRRLVHRATPSPALTTIPPPSPGLQPLRVMEIPFTDWIEQPVGEGEEPVCLPRRRVAKIYLSMPTAALREIGAALAALKETNLEAAAARPEILAPLLAQLLPTILLIWKQSEPRMDLERLEKGTEATDIIRLLLALLAKN